MFISKNFKNVVALILVVLIFSMPLRAQSPENDKLIQSIPAKTLFCVRINNFTNSLTQMDQFLAGVSPMGMSMLVQAQLMGLLGSPQLTGLNMNGSFMIFGTELASKTAQPSPMPDIFVGILAPVTNYKQFINGIANKTSADENGVTKITTAGGAISVTQLGDYALASWANDYDMLVEYKKQAANLTKTSLASNLDSAEAKLAINEPIWIYGNMQQASETFGPMLLGAIEGMKASLSNIDQTNAQMPMANVQNVLDMYISIIKTLMNEIKAISLTINPSSTVLKMTQTTTAIPETEMAKMFVANTSSGSNNLLPFLEDGAIMNYAFTMNSPLMEKTGDLQVKLLSMLFGNNIKNEDLEKMKSTMESLMNSINGPVAYTFCIDKNIKPPFKGRYVIDVKDESKFKELINDASEIVLNIGIADMYKSMGLDTEFTIEQNVETYKGVSIDSATFSMTTTQANNPQAQMIESMYGDGFDYRWGIVNGLFACTIGEDADKTIKTLIDEIQAGNTNQPGSELKAAMSLLPDAGNADILMTINVLRSINLVSSLMSSSMIPIQIPSIDVPTKSNIAIAGKAGNGKMTINIAFPKEHLAEIMMAVMTIQQQMMMQNQPAPGR